MALFLKLHESTLFKYLSVIFLIMWALTVSIKLILIKDQTLLIRVDKFQTTVIEGKSEERIPLEIENFLNYFVGNFYTYSSQNFDIHIDESLKLIVLDEARKHIDKLNKASDKMKLSQIYQTSSITKITNLKDMTFELNLRVKKQENEKDSEDDFKIVLQLETTDRTKSNPFGIKVVKIDESYN